MVLRLRYSRRGEKERQRAGEREMVELEGAYLSSHRTTDKTGEFYQIGQTDPSLLAHRLLQHIFYF
jgi:hypothetical protein